MAKIYVITAFVVSAFDHGLGGLERRHADPLVMMLAMCVRSYAGVVGCGSVLKRDVLELERDVLALDHTRVSV